MTKFKSSKRFDVEHALIMYASDYVTMPARDIYNDAAIEPYEEIIDRCHIYLIGLTPKLNLKEFRQEGCFLICSLELLGMSYELQWQLSKGENLKYEFGNGWLLLDEHGARKVPDSEHIHARLADEFGAVGFEVLYIGQAFGKKGKRNALDRLRRHETLQKISLSEVPQGYKLSILMLSIHPDSYTATLFNPHASDHSESKARIKNGLDKLFEVNDAERTSLYEASLIRYFRPKFNVEFKNSFPSTNMKTLRDCYEKDFSAVIAEICINGLPFHLFSECVQMRPNHIAKHDLHAADDRKVFFAPLE